MGLPGLHWGGVGSLVASIAGQRLDVNHDLEAGKGARTDVLNVLRQGAKVRHQVADDLLQCSVFGGDEVFRVERLGDVRKNVLAGLELSMYSSLVGMWALRSQSEIASTMPL